MAGETENLSLDPDTVTRGVESVFQDPSLAEYFVAEIEGEVVGSLMITREWSDWRAGLVWWIQSVYVHPDHRGQGVYSDLYRFIQQRVIADPGVRGVRLYVARTNSRAQEVYSRLGMDGEHYVVFEWME